MAEREFDITIDAQGSVELHVKAFRARGCLDALKLFEQIVGALKSEEGTSESYEPE
jgi:hypothetical protein